TTALEIAKILPVSVTCQLLVSSRLRIKAILTGRAGLTVVTTLAVREFGVTLAVVETVTAKVPVSFVLIPVTISVGLVAPETILASPGKPVTCEPLTKGVLLNVH